MADINKELPDDENTTTTATEPSNRARKKSPPLLPQDPVSTTAASRRIPDRVLRALERAKFAARLADDNRGKDILVLDLRAATPLIDFFVIATANSRRQAYAIASEIDMELKKLGESKLGIEGAEEGRWILVDYGDFVIHVFSEEARTYYGLEDIWGDAERVDWVDPNRPRQARIVEEAPIVHHIDDLSDDELPEILG